MHEALALEKAIRSGETGCKVTKIADIVRSRDSLVREIKFEMWKAKVLGIALRMRRERKQREEIRAFAFSLPKPKIQRPPRRMMPRGIAALLLERMNISFEKRTPVRKVNRCASRVTRARAFVSAT